jgi:hypothetical protein
MKSTDTSVWVRELYMLFAPVRTETSKQSEKQVNAVIAKAVSAVRRKRQRSLQGAGLSDYERLQQKQSPRDSLPRS